MTSWELCLVAPRNLRNIISSSPDFPSSLVQHSLVLDRIQELQSQLLWSKFQRHVLSLRHSIGPAEGQTHPNICHCHRSVSVDSTEQQLRRGIIIVLSSCSRKRAMPVALGFSNLVSPTPLSSHSLSRRRSSFVRCGYSSTSSSNDRGGPKLRPTGLPSVAQEPPRPRTRRRGEALPTRSLERPEVLVPPLPAARAPTMDPLALRSSSRLRPSRRDPLRSSVSMGRRSRSWASRSTI